MVPGDGAQLHQKKVGSPKRLLSSEPSQEIRYCEIDVLHIVVPCVNVCFNLGVHSLKSYRFVSTFSLPQKQNPETFQYLGLEN